MHTSKLFLPAIILLFFIPLAAQVQVDHPIQLTGAGANAEITGIKTVANNQDATNVNIIQNGSLIYASATGSGNNFILNISPAINGYQAGMVFNFISNQNITGAATLTVNSLAAIPIVKYINHGLGQCDIQNGQVVTVVYDGTNFQMTSAPVNVNGVPSVSITANPTGPIGSGISVTFTATPSNGGSGPTYQWLVNGANVGTGGTTYTSSSLNNGDMVSCVMTTANATCGSPATSDTITMSVTSSTLQNSLVAYWKMDESTGNPVDASGNGHTLTNNNGCTFGTQYGVINNGVNLNGTGTEDVNRSNQEDLTCSDAGFPAGTTDRTFAFWMKSTATPVSGNQVGLLTYGTENTHEFASVIYQNNGTNAYGIYVSGWDDADFSSAAPLSVGTWYHIAVTISNSGANITLYVNGAYVATSTGHAWNTILGGTLTLGDYASGYYFTGNMDEFGIWSRALSATEISQLYNAGAGLQYPF